MANTKIEWADKVWNPLRGCSKASEGCRNCYAMTHAARFGGPGMPFDGLARFTGNGAQWSGRVDEISEKLNDPRRWKTPKRVFVNSMSDLFHEKVSDAFISDVFATMARCPQHTFMVLTKRAKRMFDWFQSAESFDAMEFSMREGAFWPLENVWLGVSVENQAAADDRVKWLVGTPAVKRFVSAEPLLGDVELTRLPCPIFDPRSCEDCPACYDDGVNSCLNGFYNGLDEGIDWVIVGCETGRSSRDMNEAWVRNLRDQCLENETAFFYKQAKDEHGRKQALPFLDGEQYAEFPDKD